MDTVHRHYLSDLKSGERIGELDGLRGRQLGQQLSIDSSFNCVVDVDNAAIGEIRDLKTSIVTTRYNPYLNTEDIIGNNIVTGRSLVFSEDGYPQMQVSCGGGNFKLSKTIANDSTNSGLENPNGLQVPTPTPAHQTICNLIDYANNKVGNTYTRAILANQGTTLTQAITDLGGPQKISEVQDTLSTGLSGFDWLDLPREYIDDLGPVCSEIVMDRMIGQQRQNLKFQYNTGKRNCTAATFTSDSTQFANSILHTASGRVPYKLSDVQADSIIDVGVYQDYIDSDVVQTDLREKLIKLNLIYRSKPRILFEFTPSRSDMTGFRDPLGEPTVNPFTGEVTEAVNDFCPIPLVDYWPGDWVAGEAYWSDHLIESGILRIYGVTVNIDDMGAETAVLQLYLN